MSHPSNITFYICHTSHDMSHICHTSNPSLCVINNMCHNSHICQMSHLSHVTTTWNICNGSHMWHVMGVTCEVWWMGYVTAVTHDVCDTWWRIGHVTDMWHTFLQTIMTCNMWQMWNVSFDGCDIQVFLRVTEVKCTWHVTDVTCDRCDTCDTSASHGALYFTWPHGDRCDVWQMWHNRCDI